MGWYSMNFPPERQLIEKQKMKITTKSWFIFFSPELLLIANYSRLLFLQPAYCQTFCCAFVHLF